MPFVPEILLRVSAGVLQLPGSLGRNSQENVMQDDNIPARTCIDPWNLVGQ